MLAAIVDTAALWKIVLAVFAVGIGVTAIFGQGTMAFARIEQARREGRSGAAALDYAVVALAALVCVAALVVGFLAIDAQVSRPAGGRAPG
jgi:UPF0716 family protein affecting phage T7 exclusion